MMADDRMADGFGGRLRAARERKGISLRQIATATKISVAVLEALERNDLSRLPGGIFSRAFVRSYAAAVGLDPEATVQDFVTEFPHDSVIAGHLTSQPVEDTEAFESDRRMAGTLLWILLVSVPIAGGVLYFETLDRSSTERPDMVAVSSPPRDANPRQAVGSGPLPSATAAVARPAAELPTAPKAAAPAVEKDRPRPAGETAAPGAGAKRPATEPAMRPEAGPAARPEAGPAARLAAGPAAGGGAPPSAAAGPAQTPPAQSLTDAVTASGPPAGAASTGPSTAATASDHLTVELSIHRPVWVSATVDGQKTIERLLQPGERQTVEVRREMVFTAGDASAISMTLNGADARSLGKSGEVVTTRLSLTNFKDYLQVR